MKDRTPKRLRCPGSYCPAVLEITPADLQCFSVSECPAVFEVAGNLAVIGKQLSPELLAEVAHRIGPDAAPCVISPEYLRELSLPKLKPVPKKNPGRPLRNMERKPAKK